VYSKLVRPLLFRLDAERAHDAAVGAAELASRSAVLCRAVAARRPEVDERLAVEVAGLRMRSPLGLAAGFDKSARAVPFLAALGFGHVEIGSVSADPSAGNPRPRLFRLPSERAIVVHYGVPNDGAERVAARLAGRRAAAPVGVNVVSTNRLLEPTHRDAAGAGRVAGPGDDSVGQRREESDDAVIGDYVHSVTRLQDLADYVCLNLSCPNTRDGQGFFADRSRLRALLDRLGEAGVRRPLFIKVAPFSGPGELDSFLEAVSGAAFVSGFSVNLPPRRPAGLSMPAGMRGAVSGRPCAPAAERTVAELYRSGDRVVIGSGGVFTAADAYRMIRLGASLVQVYTALAYEGPGVVRRIIDGLASLVARDGFASVSEAVGISAGEHERRL
jgi:dihydroorotate dehydrogenase